ncbi:hypothetical protein ADK38_20040, partial [Streptomyces varsoviensis]
GAADTLVHRTPAAFHCEVREALLAALAAAVVRRRTTAGPGATESGATGPGATVEVEVGTDGREPAPWAGELDVSRTVGRFAGTRT